MSPLLQQVNTETRCLTLKLMTSIPIDKCVQRQNKNKRERVIENVALQLNLALNSCQSAFSIHIHMLFFHSNFWLICGKICFQRRLVFRKKSKWIFIQMISPVPGNAFSQLLLLLKLKKFQLSYEFISFLCEIWISAITAWLKMLARKWKFTTNERMQYK